MAQSVGLSGMLGGKALLIVDGAAPKTVAPGETYRGVKVVATQGDVATIEVDGKRTTLRVGDAPASVGGGASTANAGGDRAVLTASEGGHFMTRGQINGKSVQMMVDTGATAVSISAQDAQRMGIRYENGQPVRMNTANGTSVGWQIKLSSVRVGDVTVHEVDAIVSPAPMPFVLLGNSFLGRFQMTRTNDQMVLTKRY
jgi:aspartyl protease family protein